MTFTLGELLLIIATATFVVTAVFLIRYASQVAHTATEVELTAKHFRDLTPKAEKFLAESTAEMQALRGVTRRSEAVVQDVHQISTELRQGVSLLGLVKKSQAAAAGARAGWHVLRGGDQETNNDKEEEK